MMELHSHAAGTRNTHRHREKVPFSQHKYMEPWKIDINLLFPAVLVGKNVLVVMLLQAQTGLLAPPISTEKQPSLPLPQRIILPREVPTQQWLQSTAPEITLYSQMRVASDIPRLLATPPSTCSQSQRARFSRG